MIDINFVIQIHDLLIDRFGGGQGLRNKDLLESAIKRPFQTFEDKELYPTPTDKAAAILESVVNNHPFLDGNKRIGYFLMRLLLLENGLDIIASQKEKYDFVISVASGKSDFEYIKSWLEERISENES